MDCRYGGLYANPADFRQIIILGQVRSGGKLCMGVILTRDGGASWTEVRVRDEANSESTAAAVDPRNPSAIYIGGRTAAYGPALGKSLNGGAAWTDVTAGIRDSGGIECIAVDPTDSKILYCGAHSLWRSADGGATWSECNLPQWGSPAAIAINPVDPNEVFVGNSLGVYRSLDRGLTWTDISAGMSVPCVSGFYFDAKTRILFVATRGSGVWKRAV